jgi:hypothetical protein
VKANEIDWQSGRVVFWDMDSIDPDRPLANQLSELKEDLVQVIFPGDLLIDVGWYPEFSEEGAFLVTVVNEMDWDEPLMQERCTTMRELKTSLIKAIALSSNVAVGMNERKAKDLG